jgi:predicted nucleotidyltransferase
MIRVIIPDESAGIIWPRIPNEESMRRTNLRVEGRIMKTLEEIRAILIEHQQILRERYGVRDLAIFGSYARGEQTRISDVDLLVRLERPIGLKFFELWDYLEEILDLKVDLLTSEALQQKPALWKHVREDLLYAWD